jgi:hypothetical protein
MTINAFKVHARKDIRHIDRLGLQSKETLRFVCSAAHRRCITEIR